MAKRKDQDNLLLRNARQLSKDEVVALVKAHKAGDREAGGRLIESQSAWIMTCLRRQSLPKNVDFDDLLSELSIVILRALHIYDPERTELTTFVGIVVQRRAKRIAKKLAGHSYIHSAGDSMYSLSDTRTSNELMEQLEDAVSQSGVRESSMAAVSMHFSGMKPQAIRDALVHQYHCGRSVKVEKTIRACLTEIHATALKLGYEVPVECAPAIKISRSPEPTSEQTQNPDLLYVQTTLFL